MVGVDVCCLYFDQTLSIFRSGAKAFSQQLGHNFDQLSM